jgi:hypothetical protein
VWNLQTVIDGGRVHGEFLPLLGIVGIWGGEQSAKPANRWHGRKRKEGNEKDFFRPLHTSSSAAVTAFDSQRVMEPLRAGRSGRIWTTIGDRRASPQLRHV